jgi:hypothetical protein
MKNSINAYILSKLFKTTSQDDIIYSVCQKTGLDWEDAQALVERVKDEHQEEIEARQMPVKSILAFGFYIAGIILIVAPLVYLWVMLDVSRMFLTFVTDPTNAETALELFRRRCMLLGWFQLPSLFFSMAVGVGIINVNLRYMQGIWKTLFRKWNVID